MTRLLTVSYFVALPGRRFWAWPVDDLFEQLRGRAAPSWRSVSPALTLACLDLLSLIAAREVGDPFLELRSGSPRRHRRAGVCGVASGRAGEPRSTPLAVLPLRPVDGRGRTAGSSAECRCHDGVVLEAVVDRCPALPVPRSPLKVRCQKSLDHQLALARDTFSLFRSRPVKSMPMHTGRVPLSAARWPEDVRQRGDRGDVLPHRGQRPVAEVESRGSVYRPRSKTITK
jgi:hypothetical protein